MGVFKDESCPTKQNTECILGQMRADGAGDDRWEDRARWPQILPKVLKKERLYRLYGR